MGSGQESWMFLHIIQNLGIHTEQMCSQDKNGCYTTSPFLYVCVCLYRHENNTMNILSVNRGFLHFLTLTSHFFHEPVCDVNIQYTWFKTDKSGSNIQYTVQGPAVASGQTVDSGETECVHESLLVNSKPDPETH